jgi:hypothetical protein
MFGTCKAMAILLHSNVPHAGAEVEQLFSALGATKSARRTGLDVDTFERLGNMWSYLHYKLYEKNKWEGKETHRRHAHMQTNPDGEVKSDLVRELQTTFTYIPPLGPARINQSMMES